MSGRGKTGFRGFRVWGATTPGWESKRRERKERRGGSRRRREGAGSQGGREVKEEGRSNMGDERENQTFTREWTIISFVRNWDEYGSVGLVTAAYCED